ncbi:putative S-acyltransferase [Apostasia shenzhenica]|uniref:S-acyltransferase n=1 Tax=Apostasia shenzhenica TaxID=1088818 RepID=A0A2I0AGY8_9ASPA|nr:putative S-acyltransferase [Apostasia shenzhenica]
MSAVSTPHACELADEGAARTEAPRVYQVWRGNNVFFLKGRLIFGPDVRSLFLTMFLIVAPATIFCVFVARKLMDKFPHHWGISIMVVAVAFTLYDLCLLLLTSGRDPGIIPRNIRPPEPEGSDGSIDFSSVQTPQFRLPQMKDVVVNGITVKTKYCDTCMLYRPPRCSHCSICNNCVERFDHHCPWVGQCIGQRNYRFFYMFVFSTTLLCFYVFAFCWVYIVKIKDAEETNIWKAMGKTPASVFLIVYTFLTSWFVGGLSVFHLYLVSTNQTTYENFRYRYERKVNPYNRGTVANFKEIFFAKISPSNNNFRARVPSYHELQFQQSTGAFLSPYMGKVIGDIETGKKVIDWGEHEFAEPVDMEAGFGGRAIDDKHTVSCDSAFDPEPVSERRTAANMPPLGLASDPGADHSNVHGYVVQEIRSASR